MVTLPPLPIKTKNVKQKLPHSFPFTFVKVRPGIFLFCVNQRLIMTLIAAIVKDWSSCRRCFFFSESRVHYMHLEIQVKLNMQKPRKTSSFLFGNTLQWCRNFCGICKSSK